MGFIPKIKICLVLFISFSTGISPAQENKENPYGLKIIATVAEYQQLIQGDSLQKLVDLEKVIPGIRLDIRYATSNNFTHNVVYTNAKAYARVEVARALSDIENDLKKKGLGLKIYDAYRPYAATLLFYKIMKSAVFVAAPWQGSRHNRGCAVDVNLISLKTGKELEMPTAFDDFSEKASPTFMDLPATALKNRQVLMEVMARHGFTVFPDEWWHFDFRGWEKYGLLDLTFEELN